MKRHLFRQLLLVAAISTVLTMPAAWGQEEHTVPVSPIGPELPYTELLKPPLPVSGLQMPLMFSSETARSNFVMGNLQVGSAYDDNLFSTASNHISNVSYLVLPSIDIVQTRERWNWDFGYSPGFTINNQRLVERNQVCFPVSLGARQALDRDRCSNPTHPSLRRFPIALLIRQGSI